MTSADVESGDQSTWDRYEAARRALDVDEEGARVVDCSQHKGHKRYVGGIMDGEVAHLTAAHPTDYPQTFGTLLRNGVRSWYEIDYEASQGTEVVYRCIGVSKNFPGSALPGGEQ